MAQGRESGELERELGEMFSETKLQAENVNELKEETEVRTCTCICLLCTMHALFCM